jgi:hypothetical protein
LHRHAISSAIREAAALGFVEVTEQGHAGNAEFRSPNKFRLTYANSIGMKPTNEWEKIQTDEEALAIARVARKASQKKQNPSAGKRHVSVPETITEREISQ